MPGSLFLARAFLKKVLQSSSVRSLQTTVEAAGESFGLGALASPLFYGSSTAPAPTFYHEELISEPTACFCMAPRNTSHGKSYGPANCNAPALGDSCPGVLMQIGRSTVLPLCIL